jgi:hypothetical protein
MVAQTLKCNWNYQDYYLNFVSTHYTFRASRHQELTLLAHDSISFTGLVVLGGHTSVKNPRANFENSFEGTTGSGYGLANALVKVNFAYAGYTNAFNVVNEVKVPPESTLFRIFALLTIL